MAKKKVTKAAARTKKTGTAATGVKTGSPMRLGSSREDFERMFDQMLRRPLMGPFWERLQELRPVLDSGMPKVDIIDRNNEVLVRAEVPGFKKGEIEISLSGNLFTVKGQTKHEEKEEKGDFYRSEISQSSFSRTVTLPVDVDEAGAKAQMRDGILEVTLPKAEKAKKRAINIA